MNAQSLAQRAYSNTAGTIRSARSIEYDLFAKVTRRIKEAAKAGPSQYPALVKALSDNQRLWTALAVDVADDDNALPNELRARIFYLAEFVSKHTNLVLTKKARITPLLEINAAVLAGLGGRRMKK